MIGKYEVQVGEPDIDGYGHVGYDVHLRWFKEGHRRFLGSIRCGFDELENKHKIKIMVRHAEIDYTDQLHICDDVAVITAIERIGRTSLTYSNKLEKHGSSVSNARITVVFVGEAGKPVEIPEDVRRKLQDCLEPERYDDFGAPIESPH